MSPIFIITLVASSNFSYDDHTFGLNGTNSAFVLEDDSGWFPQKQDNYVIQNIGRVKVSAELWYGTEVQWIGVECQDSVLPGERKILDNGGKIYYVTGLKVYNADNYTRAIIHAEGGSLITPYVPPEIDVNKLLRDIAIFSTKYIPYTGKILAELIHFFWPENKPNLWKEVVDKIEPLLDETVMRIIDPLLNGKILYYEDQISSLNDEMNDIKKPHQHYMNIAMNLVGFENFFMFPNQSDHEKTTNFRLLPLYSNAVSLKMNYYMLGIRNQEKIGLSDENIMDLMRYVNRTVVHATDYITGMLKEPVDKAYNTCDVTRIFDCMMTIRTHLAIHGEEYLPIWKNMLNNPHSPDIVYNDVISYSDFFGRPTANLYSQATPVEVEQPLNPKLIQGRRNRLVSVKVYTADFNFSGSQKIGGIKVIFENLDEYIMGTVTKNSTQIGLNGTHISSLTAFGEGVIDGLIFYLADGRNYTLGTAKSEYFKTFELPDHHIASLYLDSTDRMGQAANIAVSYQLNTK